MKLLRNNLMLSMGVLFVIFFVAMGIITSRIQKEMSRFDEGAVGVAKVSVVKLAAERKPRKIVIDPLNDLLAPVRKVKVVEETSAVKELEVPSKKSYELSTSNSPILVQ